MAVARFRSFRSLRRSPSDPCHSVWAWSYRDFSRHNGLALVSCFCTPSASVMLSEPSPRALDVLRVHRSLPRRRVCCWFFTAELALYFFRNSCWSLSSPSTRAALPDLLERCERRVISSVDDSYSRKHTANAPAHAHLILAIPECVIYDLSSHSFRRHVQWMLRTKRRSMSERLCLSDRLRSACNISRGQVDHHLLGVHQIRTWDLPVEPVALTAELGTGRRF